MIVKDIDVMFDDTEFFRYMKDNSIKATCTEEVGVNEYAIYSFEGTREALIEMFKELFDDEELIDS